MSDEVRYCPREGCGKKLRRHNRKGICGYCQRGDKPAGVPRTKVLRAARRKGATPPPGPSVDAFDLVATHIGLDPATVVSQLKGHWLANLKNHVRLED